MIVATLMIAAALLDAALAGFRAAAGRDGRIAKRTVYLRAVTKGVAAGAALVAVMGGATAAIVTTSADPDRLWAELLSTGARMIFVLVIAFTPVVVTLMVYAVAKNELRTLATVAILGPFTLARPYLIGVAMVFGLLPGRSAATIVLTVAATAGVLYVGRWLDRDGGKLTAWTWRAAPETKEERGEPSERDDDSVAVDPIGQSIDLHFFAPRDVPSVVQEYLREAHAKGHREVRLIHGRGKGIQRQRVQKILARHRLVASFRSDGLGSTIAVLAPKRSKLGA